MIYILTLFILGSGYYTLTYAISLWKNDKNRLGAFGTGMIAIIGTIVPIVFMFIKG